MKITSEEQLLDQDVRRKLIEQFDAPENQARKAEAFKTYECLKDKTSNYVLDLLLRQFDFETVVEMQYAVSNISILRKVIEKLAKVYSNGVKRTMANESDTQAIEQMADHLNLNQTMAKLNRYFRAFKNTLAYIRPIKREDGFNIRVDALPPFNYDVIESPENPEEALGYVLSDYIPTRHRILFTVGDAAFAGRSHGETREVRTPGATKELAQAAPQDDRREFIWWTKNFHFTTNVKGEIISSDDAEISNPIAMSPFVNIAGDQDGQFWAEGGGDLVDAGIKINTMITNVNHVAISQGYGQLYMTGKNLPKSVKVGPNHCVQLEQNEGEPSPQVGYLNSNPPIDSLRGLVEMYMALMLSTNNLSTSGFSTSLQGGKDFASGIALMIDKAESIEDIEEQAQIFIEKEPEIWTRIFRWKEVYESSEALTEKLRVIRNVKEPQGVQVKFPSPKPILTEQEHLAIIEKRKELGINTMIELIMRDDPSLSEEEAEEKLMRIMEEKMNRMASALSVQPGGNDGDQGEGRNREPEQDGSEDRPDNRTQDSEQDQNEDQA